MDHHDGCYSVSLRVTAKGLYSVSMNVNGQEIKGSPLHFSAYSLSAEASYLEVAELGPFPNINQKIDLKIVAADQNGVLLKEGGGKFSASVTINGNLQVSYFNWLSHEGGIVAIIRLLHAGRSHWHKSPKWNFYPLSCSTFQGDMCGLGPS